jgi:putative transposase
VDICVKSAALYNKTLYIIRLLFDNSISLPSYFELIDIMSKVHPDYYTAFTSVDIAKFTIKKAHDNYISFFKAKADYKINPKKYKGEPHIPTYLLGNNRIFIATCSIGSISKKNFMEHNLIGLSNKSNIRTKFNADITYDDIKNFSIVPLNGLKGTFKLIVTYKQKKNVPTLEHNKDNIIAIDPGLHNIFTITSNTQNFNPILVNGSEVKSINQGYNKNISYFNSQLDYNITTKRYDLDYDRVRHTNEGISGTNSYLMLTYSTSGQVIRDVYNNTYFDIDNNSTSFKNIFLIKSDDKGDYTEVVKYTKPYSKHMNKLTVNRSNKMNDIGYKLANSIVDLCINNDIGTIVIGKNKGWKDKVNLGKKSNQNFTYIPLAKFIDKIVYVAGKYGIDVILNEESYTSKCSFLDLEPICKHEVYKGERTSRNWFKSEDGRIIHADVNGAYNIMRKYKPEIFRKEASTNCVMVNNASGEVVVNRLNPVRVEISDIIKGKKIADIISDKTTTY